MKKSDLKQIISEALTEVMTEVAPPEFPKALYNKIKGEYPNDPAKAYGTMWKIANKKNEGDKRTNEIWEHFSKVDELGGQTAGVMNRAEESVLSDPTVQLALSGAAGAAVGAKGVWHAAKNASLAGKNSTVGTYLKNVAKGIVDPRTYVPKKVKEGALPPQGPDEGAQPPGSLGLEALEAGRKDINKQIADLIKQGNKVSSSAVGRMGDIVKVDQNSVYIKLRRGVGVTTFNAGDKVEIKPIGNGKFVVKNTGAWGKTGMQSLGTDDSGYDSNDPKHPTWAERMADKADRDRGEKRDSGLEEGLGDWAGWGKKTPEQETSEKKLEQAGFQYTHHFPEQDREDPDERMVVIMQKKRGPRTLSGEIGSDGSVNGQSVDEFLAWAKQATLREGKFNIGYEGGKPSDRWREVIDAIDTDDAYNKGKARHPKFPPDSIGPVSNDETDMDDPEEKREVQIGKQILKLCAEGEKNGGMISVKGYSVSSYDKIAKLAEELIRMHGVSITNEIDVPAKTDDGLSLQGTLDSMRTK